MSVTVDILRGRVAVYLTCDCCGLPILGDHVTDQANDDREYDRHRHAGTCPVEEPDEVLS